MNKEEPRKHGHWKIWGHSLTCSVCDHCCEGGNYCEVCGSIMDEPAEYWCPPLPFNLTQITRFLCPFCGNEIWGSKNYCSKCGTRLKEVEE